MEFTTTTRGALALILNGFKYVVNRKEDGSGAALANHQSADLCPSLSLPVGEDILEHAVLKPNDYLSVLSQKYMLEKIIKDANQLKLMQLSTTLSKFFSVLCDCDS